MVKMTPIEELKAAHHLLAEYNYELRPVERGYANRTLYINLDDYSFEERPVLTYNLPTSHAQKGFIRTWM